MLHLRRFAATFVCAMRELKASEIAQRLLRLRTIAIVRLLGIILCNVRLVG
jgi:hypothetical protein